MSEVYKFHSVEAFVSHLMLEPWLEGMKRAGLITDFEITGPTQISVTTLAPIRGFSVNITAGKDVEIVHS